MHGKSKRNKGDADYPRNNARLLSRFNLSANIAHHRNKQKKYPGNNKRVATGAVNTDLTNSSMACAPIRNESKFRSNTTLVIFRIYPDTGLVRDQTQ